MQDLFVARIASELQISPAKVAATARLLAEGATVPFISRYRKEVTGSLDEVAVTSIRDRMAQLVELEQRRESIIKSLSERDLLSDALKISIGGAETLSVLEDLYAPYRPKRRTRATIAKEAGLEPLALLIFDEQATLDPLAAAVAFVDPAKQIVDVTAALAGARDILAERFSDDATVRARLRELSWCSGSVRSRVLLGKESEGAKFKDYFDWTEPVGKIPSHRLLAIRRGEEEGFLMMRIQPPEEEAIAILFSLFLKARETPAAEQVRLAAIDSYKRLVGFSIEAELRLATKKKADEEAIRVFSGNLRELLLASALGEKCVLALDPGFRTGCKTVVLDRQGKLLHHDVLYPTAGSAGQLKDAAEAIHGLVQKHGIEAIAIGNGTAGREAEQFIRSLKLPPSIAIVMVNESGASIYSASDVAREEFPNEDLTVRGAVSIGRRLMDPLAELVKLDPKSIGVGQYQHDVDPAALQRGLDDVVVSCVNRVGVELNTASKQLLSYVSGLGSTLAANIVTHRNQNGPFKTRQALLQVPRLGPKAFEQCAGFLRIRDAVNPLDSSAVHPERYGLVDAMARDTGCSVADLVRDGGLRSRVQLAKYVTESVGLPTLKDIIDELARPGRDPREKFEAFTFQQGVSKMEDLQPGMKLPGIVTNVTAFGAFVDIGVHQDGLVHVSQLADRFVKEAAEVVKVGQKVHVTVTELDLPRKRIALSMKANPQIGAPKDGRTSPTGPRPLATDPRSGPRPNARPTFNPAAGSWSALGDAFDRAKK